MTTLDRLEPREVPLGGVRAIQVRRTLPHRDRTTIGAWCFVDHFGPTTTPMDVAPHPHCGLQTVTWIFDGEVEHRDSAGNVQLIRPGEVNLMTAGHGISHSEVSRGETVHGIQLWVAQPNAGRDGVAGFDHFVTPVTELPVMSGTATARVFVGALEGVSSPVRTFSPLVGAELQLSPGTALDLAVDRTFEHGVLLDSGALTIAPGDAMEEEALALQPAELGIIEAGREHIRFMSSDEPVRAVLIGGAPLHEELMMWWNFVARTYEEIVAARDEWQADSGRFGQVEGYDGAVARIPAPELPPVRLKPRRNRH
ncbi:pirin family protein [Flexivirga caeni]|uniref:pirin family protein n=1 Tax=Flexivirga caeni TaxID=2294115 RepID=UPI001FE80C49|nr:pirin family protein [Flexivirga caeni]